MELVAYLGKDKENWGQVTALIRRGEWEKVLLIGSREAKEFPLEQNSEFILVDSEKPMLSFKQELLEKIKAKIGGDFEVALSLASGTGKEHMALISALLNIPVGVKIVVYTKEGLQFIT